jgi:hypothetical protein
MTKSPSLLEDWDIDLSDLSTLINDNPSLRGMLFGYIAESKLRTQWFSNEAITHAIKYDDHDRQRKGDLVVTYKDQLFVVECKSLQTDSIEVVNGVWYGRTQCDGSDRRFVKLSNGSKVLTTLLPVGEFDILAVNCFSFGNKWKFAFAKNSDLPKTNSKKYTERQRNELLASLIPVSWPPKPPFHDNPYKLMDELIKRREVLAESKKIKIVKKQMTIQF